MANGVGHVDISNMLNKDFLVKNGSCISCERKVQSTSVIKCTSCCDMFHAVCPSSNKQNKICNETMLRNFNQNSTRDNFKWYCNVCLTLYEQDKFCGIAEKLNAILLKFDMLSDAFRGIKDEVANNTKSINALTHERNHVVDIHADKAVNSSSNGRLQQNVWNMQSQQQLPIENPALLKSRDENKDQRSRKRKREKNSLIMKCNEDGKSPDLAEIRDVAISYGIPVNQVNVTANNNAVITLPTEDALNKLKPLLSTKPSLKQHQVDKVQSKLPRISILDIDEDFEESDFVDTVKLQNPEIADLISNGAVFSDIYIKHGEGKKYSQINVTVSENIRKLIKNRRSRLYLGLKSCRVVDRKKLNRCYKCHDHNHIAKHCDNTPCCGYCMSEDHESDDCDMKIDIENNKSNFKCINCQRSRNPNIGHSVYWPLCPVNKYHRKTTFTDNPNEQGNLNS